MKPIDTIAAIKNFVDSYDLKHAVVARGVGIEKATLSYYFKESVRPNRFYEKEIINYLQKMRDELEVVIAKYNENQQS